MVEQRSANVERTLDVVRKTRGAKPLSCECGQCPKCKRRSALKPIKLPRVVADADDTDEMLALTNGL